jgi:hypothetical protein
VSPDAGSQSGRHLQPLGELWANSTGRGGRSLGKYGGDRQGAAAINMADEKEIDLIDLIAPRPRRKPRAQKVLGSLGDAPAGAVEATAGAQGSLAPEGGAQTFAEGRLEVRPIGTPLGLKELAALHKKTWSNLNVQEKRVHMLLWPLALHFGLYHLKATVERRRPPLIGAFWARCLADAPLTLGHLYPAALFKDMMASDVWEFGGMVIDTSYQGRGLVKMLSDTARIFLFSRRPKLLITNPIEPLYEMYRQFGLKTVGNHPVEHPHAYNVKVWLMYGRFDDLSKPYYM